MPQSERSCGQAPSPGEPTSSGFSSSAAFSIDRHHFHQELSFSDFDQAMEDTVLAINTGYWRTRDDHVIERGEGKTHLINADWRMKLDDVVRLIGEVRQELRRALALNHELYQLKSRSDRLDDLDHLLRWDGALSQRMDDLRNAALESINSVLIEGGLQPLNRIGT